MRRVAARIPATEDFRERTLSAGDGRRLYYRDYGDSLSPGAPVVCLPGLTRNCADFHLLASRLSKRRRVVCLDYRGRGRSEYDPDWRNYRSPVILNDVIQLLAANNLHRVVICGVSFGGLLAMALAAAAPTLLAGVILDDVGPELDPSGIARIVEYISNDPRPPDWPSAVAALKDLMPNLSFSTDEDWLRFARGTFQEDGEDRDGRLRFDWDLALAMPLRHDPGSEDLWPLFRALRRVPVLAIRGGQSDILSAATLARMAAEKPDLIHITLPEVGHAPSLNEAESERAIDEFLVRIDS